MGLLAWIVLGGIAGWLASLIVGVGARMGCLLNIVAGVVGAIIGGVVFNALGSHGITGFTWWSLFVAFVGAVILLALLRIIASIMKE